MRSQRREHRAIVAAPLGQHAGVARERSHEAPCRQRPRRGELRRQVAGFGQRDRLSLRSRQLSVPRYRDDTAAEAGGAQFDDEVDERQARADRDERLESACCRGRPAPGVDVARLLEHPRLEPARRQRYARTGRQQHRIGAERQPAHAGVCDELPPAVAAALDVDDFGRGRFEHCPRAFPERCHVEARRQVPAVVVPRREARGGLAGMRRRQVVREVVR